MGSCKSKESQKSGDSNIRVISNTHIEKEQKPIEAKIVLLGDQNVGKSSIAQRFCKNLFTGQHIATIGGAYMQQKIVLNNGATIKLHIWDTGGQERFRSMANLYYRDASAAILTYDITNEKSFDSINYWVEELRHKCDQEKLILCLAGNKCDVENSERKIQTFTGKGNHLIKLAFAESHHMLFFETSAKNDVGIKELFNAIAKKIHGDRTNNY
jgi:small GTP-binding protein